MDYFNALIRELKSLRLYYVLDSNKYSLRDKRNGYYKLNYAGGNEPYNFFFIRLCKEYYEELPTFSQDQLRNQFKQIEQIRELYISGLNFLYSTKDNIKKGNSDYDSNIFLLEFIKIFNTPEIHDSFPEDKTTPSDLNLIIFIEDFLVYHAFQIETIMKKIDPMIDKNYIIGFNSNLLPKTIDKIHFQMVDKKYIKSNIKDFQAVFSDNPVHPDFKPVIWLITGQKKNANKTALFRFLKLVLDLESFPRKTLRQANELFVDKRNNSIFPDKYTYPSKEEQKSSLVNYLIPIKELIMNSRP